MRNNSNRCGVLIQLNEKQSAEQVSFLAYGCQFRFENLKREEGGSGGDGNKQASERKNERGEIIVGNRKIKIKKKGKKK